MPRSSSCVFEVALGRTAKPAGVTDKLTFNRRSKTRTRPHLRDQRSRRSGGTSISAILVPAPQNLRDREFFESCLIAEPQARRLRANLRQSCLPINATLPSPFFPEDAVEHSGGCRVDH